MGVGIDGRNPQHARRQSKNRATLPQPLFGYFLPFVATTPFVVATKTVVATTGVVGSTG